MTAVGAAGEKRCWELTGLDGEPDGRGDDCGSPHYATADEAWAAYLAGERDPDDPPRPALLPRQLDFVCLTAVAVCGTILVNPDSESTIHHNDVQELLAEALSQGWTLLEDDMTCSGCEHCAVVLAGLEPPAPVLPGQLDLFTNEVVPDPGETRP